MSRFIPLADRIVVKPDDQEKVTPGGIIIPENKKDDRPRRGVVIEVGPGRIDAGERIKPEVRAGDRVLFGKIGGQEFASNDVKYLIMRESDILGVIKE